ncbi:antirepressor protein [Oceanospirillum phage vB_OliS_GJ44]|nr:antirepressor protein [Oceanospirillum phage vB_OliS_GJ44]
MNLINQLTMSSREIAELTGKRHDHVMRDIRKMLDDLGEAHPTYGGSYEDSTGRTLPCFNLDRDMTDCLLTGYSAKARMMVIKRWRELESKQVPVQQLPALPQSFAEALQLAADQARQIEEQEKALELAAPSVQFVDNYVNATGLKGFREVCKLLGVKEPVFRDFLSRNKIMYRIGNSKQWTAYQNHVDAGRFDTKTGEKNGHAYNECKFTPKGVAWVSEQWKKEQE